MTLISHKLYKERLFTYLQNYNKMKRIIIILLFIIFINSAFALDCQYTSNQYYTVEEERWYLNNTLLEGAPTQEIIEAKQNSIFHKVIK